MTFTEIGRAGLICAEVIAMEATGWAGVVAVGAAVVGAALDWLDWLD
ncbi:MAG TPA: hypothetical protein VHX59_19065 [Mycobacteriales bacterium]|nr:hypothetical protein [Mycobacteriales bacterium]